MTREEAITMIKALIGTYITCHGEEDTITVPLDNIDIEALDMAIKALELEPTTKNDLDCISRDSAIKALSYDIKRFEFKSGVRSEDNKVKNPAKQTFDFFKNLYLQNKEEIDRVAKEYKVIEADKAGSEDK